MLAIDIPGFATLRLKHLVLDYNGTLACGGVLVAGVDERLRRLAAELELHVLTADTRGRARETLGDLPVTLHRLAPGAEDLAKAAYVRALGADSSACVGNGRNDRRMLAEAALGVAVLQSEGLAADALQAADLLVPDINAALDLLLEPVRLVATLRC